MKKYEPIVCALIGAVLVVVSQWMVKTHIIPDEDAVMRMTGYWKSDWRDVLVFSQGFGFLACFSCLMAVYISRRPGKISATIIIISSIVFLGVSLFFQKFVPGSYLPNMFWTDLVSLLFILVVSWITSWYQLQSVSIEQVKKDAGITSS